MQEERLSRLAYTHRLALVSSQVAPSEVFPDHALPAEQPGGRISRLAYLGQADS